MNATALFPTRNSGERLSDQLARGLRAAIQNGVLPPNTRLMSTRALAKQLAVSRNTVTDAFDQLIAEGYLESRAGAGTFVVRSIWSTKQRAHQFQPSSQEPERLVAFRQAIEALSSTRGPLRVGAPDLLALPRSIVRCLTVRHDGASGVLAYHNASGMRGLRDGIARHVAQFRGVVAERDQIIVVEGAQAAFHLIALALAADGEAIAVEDPSYAFALAAFSARGLVPKPVPVDDDGIQTALLPREARLAFVTPAHQFPLGGALSLERRLELLSWAQRTNAYVIEDDYDSEFSANPLPALQSLDREQRVVYVGTFSKTLAPGLRIGYVIVPPHLVDLFKLVRTVTSLGISGAAQDAVTQVLARGHFVRYVRRMAGVYEQRRRIVTETLAPRLPKGFAIGPAQTGLHFALRVPIDVDDVALGDGIDDQRLLPLSRLCVVRKDCRGLVLGCSAESNSNMQRAAQAVAVHLERLQ